MRAIRIDQPGGPEVMRLEEVELPPLAKGEVRLRQHAIGINFIDIYHRTRFLSAGEDAVHARVPRARAKWSRWVRRLRD